MAETCSSRRYSLALLQEAVGISCATYCRHRKILKNLEKGCQLKITIIVLPPKKPEYSGGVERGNRTFREEFYNRSDLLEDSARGMQAALSKMLVKYTAHIET